MDDLLLPYRFSLIIFNDETDPEVAAHVRRVGVVFYDRDPAEGRPGSLSLVDG